MGATRGLSESDGPFCEVRGCCGMLMKRVPKLSPHVIHGEYSPALGRDVACNVSGLNPGV